jgi:D-allulose-6-phosphate 3-epimerase
MQVIPTLLNVSIEEFDLQLKTLSPYFNYFQIDIADGEFVPNRTIQIENLITYFTSRQPPITNCQFDFHLMVKDVQAEIHKIEQLKTIIPVKNILVHFSTLITNEQQLTANCGIVLNPEDQLVDLRDKYNLIQIPALQIMTVTPGFQGGSFIPNMLNKIEQLRLTGYRNTIMIDGGINEKTLSVILEQQYKPDVLCIGSYLTKLDGLEDKIKNLHQLMAANSL